MGEHTAPLCRIVFIIEQHLLFAVFGAGLLSSCYSSVLVGYRLAKRGPRFSSVKLPPPDTHRQLRPSQIPIANMRGHGCWWSEACTITTLFISRKSVDEFVGAGDSVLAVLV